MQFGILFPSIKKRTFPELLLVTEIDLLTPLLMLPVIAVKVIMDASLEFRIVMLMARSVAFPTESVALTVKL